MGEVGSGGGGEVGDSVSSAMSPGGREEGRGGGGASSSSDSVSPFMAVEFLLVLERGGVSTNGTVTTMSLRATGLSSLDDSQVFGPAP